MRADLLQRCKTAASYASLQEESVIAHDHLWSFSSAAETRVFCTSILKASSVILTAMIVDRYPHYKIHDPWDTPRLPTRVDL